MEKKVEAEKPIYLMGISILKMIHNMNHHPMNLDQI
jgi:hypothetical protein